MNTGVDAKVGKVTRKLGAEGNLINHMDHGTASFRGNRSNIHLRRCANGSKGFNLTCLWELAIEPYTLGGAMTEKC